MPYVELPHNKKLNLLNAHDGGWKNLEQSKWCVHCGKSFTGLSVRVWKDDHGKLWLECGTPDCDGSPMDWAPYPWWDEDHHATKEWMEKHPDGIDDEDKGGSGPGEDDVPF